MPCIMPEQPYCPCCNYGLILHNFEDSDEFCEWVCILSEKEYERIKKEKTINGENGPSI